MQTIEPFPVDDCPLNLDLDEELQVGRVSSSQPTPEEDVAEIGDPAGIFHCSNEQRELLQEDFGSWLAE